jgi:hypothetical protein
MFDSTRKCVLLDSLFEGHFDVRDAMMLLSRSMLCQVLPCRNLLHCRKCVDMSSSPKVAIRAMISISRFVGACVRRSTLMSPISITGCPEKHFHLGNVVQSCHVVLWWDIVCSDDRVSLLTCYEDATDDVRSVLLL